MTVLLNLRVSITRVLGPGLGTFREIRVNLVTRKSFRALERGSEFHKLAPVQCMTFKLRTNVALHEPVHFDAALHRQHILRRVKEQKQSSGVFYGLVAITRKTVSSRNVGRRNASRSTLSCIRQRRFLEYVFNFRWRKAGQARERGCNATQGHTFGNDRVSSVEPAESTASHPDDVLRF